MFCIERVVTQLLQNKSNMILQGTAIYQNIIQEDVKKITELISKNVIDRLFECGWSISQPERHD